MGKSDVGQEGHREHDDVYKMHVGDGNYGKM